MPEPIMIIPSDTWDTFELTGGDDEFVTVLFVSVWSKDREKLFDVNEEAECKTKKFMSMIGIRGTGVKVPKEITQKYGIRTSHYMEAVLKSVKKGGTSTDIFPKREVFEHYPAGFDSVLNASH
jgi:hypothetical protein